MDMRCSVLLSHALSPGNTSSTTVGVCVTRCDECCYREEAKNVDEGTPLKRQISENPEHLQAGRLEEVVGEKTELEHDDSLTTKEVWFLLLSTALINAQMNGVIPSVQSYAALPYSQVC